MGDRSALDLLCEHCGIQGDYYDIWGNHHVAPPHVKLALLRAMGVALTAEDQAAAVLERLQAQEWRDVTPSVKVAFEGDPVIHLSLCLATAPSLESSEWQIELEDGGRENGRFSSLKAGETRAVDGTTCTRYDAEIPAALPLGYHRLRLQLAPRIATPDIRMIVCPRRCWQPPALAGDGRSWGLNVQLYALRSARNWGIGDFTDLRQLVTIAAELGAAMVGINPLHALFPDQPEQASPYSPSNRAALNVLYLDVEAIDDFAESVAAQARVRSAAFQSILQQLRASELVDYPGVARAKFEILETLYRHFREQHLAHNTARARSFRIFQEQASEALRTHAVFEALQAHFHARDPSVAGWRQWPDAFRDPVSPAVAAFREQQRERIEYFEYLQWQAEQQLGAVNARCRDLRMPVGLYGDLAVGANGGGAETWVHADLYAAAAHIGAPPDEFNPKGQDWGLLPPIPARLVAAGHAPFAAMLRAAMRHLGALRIDHVMGLMRLFWVPLGADAREGAYVTYPLGDLMGILALESRRQRCLIVGEDLGTVPDAVRAAMHAFDILSYRLFYFERGHGDEFIPPEHFPAKALVAVATHDLPTLRGYWTAVDLAIRDRLGLYPNDDMRARQHAARPLDRERLLRALERSGLLTEEIRAHGAVAQSAPPALAHALYAYLARSPAKILSVQPEDIFEQAHQFNVPNTVDQYPNWRHKIALELEYWRDDPRLSSLASALRAVRNHGQDS